MEVLRLPLLCQKQQQLLVISEIILSQNAISTKLSGNYNFPVRGSKNFKRGLSPWLSDYVDNKTTYPDYIFPRRFFIPRVIYFQIEGDPIRHRSYFWKTRVTGIGFRYIPTEMKILSSFRLFSTGRPYDSLDYCVYISEESFRQYFTQFFIDI